eukprot:CAMPEP_0117758674 /NCGR_PEP_ID=MMETSP0947-20121206/15540_1 /TAXON_ID=44440 /ORGANISM="Chattonella subsalsa, Strain CCMP2191" /LENGTH=189 /DNA_ID=CAMNT_0005578949 /DNA_START=226 /DNA_END=795 /DNA_ORIENTATION=-
MVMLDTSSFKNGLTLEIDGSPVKIVEFLHVKPGKGAAFVRSKLKNLVTGNTVEKTFRAGESVTAAQIDKTEGQFTYEEGENYVFMDMETFEEDRIPVDFLGDTVQWLQEGSDVKIIKWNGKVIDVEVPKTLTLEVVETDPGVKGNTAQGGSKPATLATGAVVQVPLFISQGEMIKVDTEDKKYLSRADK